jgi:hypothetical protein
MARFYCPQWCDGQKGWRDLPYLASRHQKEAERALTVWMNNPTVSQGEGNPRLWLGGTPAGRVIRKPHGWNPEDNPESTVQPGFPIRLAALGDLD